MKDQKQSFGVYKHLTTTPHYDLRLEIKGEMVSWSIPKGPSLDNTVKRLSLDIKENEPKEEKGILENEKYGAGPVELWDEGSYTAEVEIEKGVRKTIKDENEAEKVMVEGLEKGELKFILHGKKLKGSFAIVKTKGFPPGVKNAWLLIKHKDEYAELGYEAKDN
jgi:bifunctional non-homologous end joining protein LigD